MTYGTISKAEYDKFLTSLHSNSSWPREVRVRYVGPYTEYGAQAPVGNAYYYRFEVTLVTDLWWHGPDGPISSATETTHYFQVPTKGFVGQKALDEATAEFAVRSEYK